jgi:hypothetical protein
MAGPDDNLRVLTTVQAKTKFSTPNAYHVLQLGPYTFGEFEHPPDLEFGITQTLAVKDAIGGTRQGQSIGGFRDDVTWSGEFRGMDAPARAIAFDNLTALGAEQLLKWSIERYFVIIRSFKHKYFQPHVIGYEITVAVMRDASGQVATANSVDMQLMQLSQQAFNSANLLAANDPGAASLAASVASLNANLPTIQPIAQNVGSAASISLAQQITSAISKASAYATSLQNFPIGQVASALGVSQLVNANVLTSTLTLMNANISNGQAPSILQVAGGTISAVCATQYKDPTLWPIVAAANGLMANRLPSGTTTFLKLPPLVGSTIS